VKGYSAQQIRDAEAPHLAAGEPLMARAAAALARECERMLQAEGISLRHARVVVLVGGGNNGGDALYAAEALAREGVTVELVRTSSRVHEAGLAAARAVGARLLHGLESGEPRSASAPDEAPSERAGVRAGADVSAGAVAKLAAAAASSDLIIDGILGTGTSADPSLRGAARVLVAAIAAKRGADQSVGAQVVAVDIPSGIHPDTGEVPDPAAVLRADVTVTFGGVKAGLLRPPAEGCAGSIRLVDIGLAADLEKLTPLVESVD
jgi:NAD(P)H-hydrate epimerase